MDVKKSSNICQSHYGNHHDHRDSPSSSRRTVTIAKPKTFSLSTRTRPKMTRLTGVLHVVVQSVVMMLIMMALATFGRWGGEGEERDGGVLLKLLGPSRRHHDDYTHFYQREQEEKDEQERRPIAFPSPPSSSSSSSFSSSTLTAMSPTDLPRHLHLQYRAVGLTMAYASSPSENEEGNNNNVKDDGASVLTLHNGEILVIDDDDETLADESRSGRSANCLAPEKVIEAPPPLVVISPTIPTMGIPSVAATAEHEPEQAEEEEKRKKAIRQDAEGKQQQQQAVQEKAVEGTPHTSSSSSSSSDEEDSSSLSHSPSLSLSPEDRRESPRQRQNDDDVMVSESLILAEDAAFHAALLEVAEGGRGKGNYAAQQRQHHGIFLAHDDQQRRKHNDDGEKEEGDKRNTGHVLCKACGADSDETKEKEEGENESHTLPLPSTDAEGEEGKEENKKDGTAVDGSKQTEKEGKEGNHTATTTTSTSHPPPPPMCTHFEDLDPLLKARILQTRLSKISREHQARSKALARHIHKQQEELHRQRDAHLSRVPQFWHSVLKALPNHDIYNLPFSEQVIASNNFMSLLDIKEGGGARRTFRTLPIDDDKVFKYHLSSVDCRRFFPFEAIAEVEGTLKLLQKIRRRETTTTSASSSSSDAAYNYYEGLLADLRKLNQPYEEHFNVSFQFAANALQLRPRKQGGEGKGGAEEKSKTAVTSSSSFYASDTGLPKMYNDPTLSTLIAALSSSATDPADLFSSSFTAYPYGPAEREEEETDSSNDYYYPKLFPFHHKTFRKFITVSSAMRASRTYGDYDHDSNNGGGGALRDLVEAQHDYYTAASSSSSSESRGSGRSSGADPSAVATGSPYVAMLNDEMEKFETDEWNREVAAEAAAKVAGMTAVDAILAKWGITDAEEEEKEAVVNEGEVGAKKEEEKENRKKKKLPKTRKTKKTRLELLEEHLAQQRNIRSVQRQSRRVQKHEELKIALQIQKMERLSQIEASREAQRLDNLRYAFGVGTEIDFGTDFVGIERDDVVPFLTGLLQWGLSESSASASSSATSSSSSSSSSSSLISRGNSVAQITSRRRLLSRHLPVAGSFFSFFQSADKYQHYSREEVNAAKMRLYGVLNDVCTQLSHRPTEVFDAWQAEQRYAAERAEEEQREAEALAALAMERLAAEDHLGPSSSVVADEL